MSVTVAYHQQTLHAASEARARSLRDTVARLSRPTSTEQSTKGTPLIPNPGLFVNVSPESSFASTDANTSEASSSKDPSHQDPAINSLTLGVSLPTIAECAIHLELLLCFTAFHRRVDNSTALDKAFSITPRPKIVRRYDNPAKKIRDPTFDVRRKLKWPAVLNIAVDRFLLWIRKVDAEMTQLSRDEWSTLFPPPIGKSITALEQLRLMACRCPYGLAFSSTQPQLLQKNDKPPQKCRPSIISMGQHRKFCSYNHYRQFLTTLHKV